MRTLTLREKRAVLLCAAVVTLYVVGFGGVRLGKALQHRRSEYNQLVREAQNLGLEIKSYQAKADSVQKLMEQFKLDPAKLKRSTAIAEASAAVQKAAAAGGVQVGSVRESSGRPANKELGTVQLEGMGPVPAVTALLGRLHSVGYPVVIESVQFTPMPGGQPVMKFNLTLVILDFDQWQKEGVGHA